MNGLPEGKKVKVWCAWPSTGTREDVHIYLLRDLQDRYGDKVEFHFPPLCVNRMFHDRARNDMVEEFLDSDCDVVWFLDSDVVPPNHVLEIVTNHYDKWQAAGAPYPVWQQNPVTKEMGICFTVYKGIADSGDKRGLFMSDVPDSGTEFVDGLATGCLFLKREVFEKLEQPYFEFKFNPKTREIIEGEDLGFCLKLHDLGIKFFTDYSMVCKHQKKACLLDMASYARRWSNASIIEYDRTVKKALTEAVNAAYKQGYDKGREEAATHLPKYNKSGLILPNSLRT